MGIDVSKGMIEEARRLHPEDKIDFQHIPIEKYDSQNQKFDYIVISDVLPFLYDISSVFAKIKTLCHCRTRIIINTYSNLWAPAIKLSENCGLKAKQPILNWVTRKDINNFLELNGFEVISSKPRILFPFSFPLITQFFNRFLTPFKLFNFACISNFTVARLPMKPFDKDVRVSVVCPCRNESGNIEKIVQRLPEMGAGTELIFVEGNSKDDTYEQCLKVMKAHPEKDIKVYRQEGKGKGDAVRVGFAKAAGDVFMILDADMTVPPEDLSAFYNALMDSHVEFVNGSRLIYEMEGKAMRFLNLCANKFFGIAFSYLMEQNVKDTLCGTKVMLKSDYERIMKGRVYFGDFDPFGDFDLLFGAAKLFLRIRDLPVRYRDRTFGETQISRFRHGLILFHMCFYAFFKLKCR